jgi:hypothetical protein
MAAGLPALGVVLHEFSMPGEGGCVTAMTGLTRLLHPPCASRGAPVPGGVSTMARRRTSGAATRRRLDLKCVSD